MTFLDNKSSGSKKSTPIQPQGVIGAPLYFQKMQFLGVFRPFLQRSLPNPHIICWWLTLQGSTCSICPPPRTRQYISFEWEIKVVWMYNHSYWLKMATSELYISFVAYHFFIIFFGRKIWDPRDPISVFVSSSFKCHFLKGNVTKERKIWNNPESVFGLQVWWRKLDSFKILGIFLRHVLDVLGFFVDFFGRIFLGGFFWEDFLWGLF